LNLATLELVFPQRHAASEGHFPGNPVIPGAVLLSDALRAIESHLGVPLAPCEIRSAKFFNPTRPGDRVQIEFSDAARGTIEFTCKVGGRPVLTGVAKCAGTSTAP
jgi:3-hydroxyacyl-[acyl-carrier-protein] dehydratase